ncbi:hypothetical protein ACIQWL_45835 [Streptomyces mirabilis]|uniref:hypothetical protein n=1 Tax=Streptomyces mirabilis TaxID=68239 RepID=UPI0037F3606D
MTEPLPEFPGAVGDDVAIEVFVTVDSRTPGFPDSRNLSGIPTAVMVDGLRRTVRTRTNERVPPPKIAPFRFPADHGGSADGIRATPTTECENLVPPFTIGQTDRQLPLELLAAFGQVPALGLSAVSRS